MTIESDFGCFFLENIVEWIADNYDPENVFDEDELIRWARDYTYDQGISSILSEEQLVAWAEFNGFVRED